jgi:hypothetical protein
MYIHELQDLEVCGYTPAIGDIVAIDQDGEELYYGRILEDRGHPGERIRVIVLDTAQGVQHIMLPFLLNPDNRITIEVIT